MSAEIAKGAGYLCSRCAKRLGGKWPKGHAATFHGGVCNLCGLAASLAAWDDWNWPAPKDRKFNQEAESTREF